MATPPVPVNRLKQIANDACESAIGSAEFYDHSKTEQWNSAIINSILKAVISESTPKDATPTHKFAVNSTIVQHLIPTSHLNKPKGTSPSPDSEGVPVKPEGAPVSTDGKPHVGRRGMHSATGAYWDEKRDGMWSYKFDGEEGKGMDVVISLIWIGI